MSTSAMLDRVLPELRSAFLDALVSRAERASSTGENFPPGPTAATIGTAQRRNRPATTLVAGGQPWPDSRELDLDRERQHDPLKPRPGVWS